MNSWKIILATVVIFGAGVITGGLLVDHVNGKRPDFAAVDQTQTPDSHATNAPAGGHGQNHPPQVPLPRLAERLSKEFVRRLDESLHLTPEQREAIAKIVADGQERNHAIWTNVAPQMRKVIQDVNQQIRTQLTPEQLKRFEELMKQTPPKRPPATNAPPATLKTATNAPAGH